MALLTFQTPSLRQTSVFHRKQHLLLVGNVLFLLAPQAMDFIRLLPNPKDRQQAQQQKVAKILQQRQEHEKDRYESWNDFFMGQQT